LSSLKKWTADFSILASELDDLKVVFDFFTAGEATEEETDQAYKKVLELVEELEFRNMLRNEEDEMGAILKINSGAGGTESQDWAQMLMRMYIRWGERNNSG
jgi:peptide chain release factor 2